MRVPPVLRPALDALAPEDPAAAGRRVRNAAVVLAIAAWLLPEFHGIGTDTTAHRAAICAAFVATAVCAHFATRDRRVRAALAATSLVAGLLVLWFGRGAGWGLGFVAYAALVFAATEARRRFVVAPHLPAEFDPLPPQPGGPPAALHTLAWLAMSVLLTLHFAWQATVVPTGSMQPTIMGAAERGGVSGDHLLVERFSYVFHDPRRWDIVVFQFPLFRERLFVKRVVGLPGEHVEIKDGDLWIDGKIAKKPPLVQQTMWVELFPRANGSNAPQGIVPAFMHDDDDPGSWKRLSESEVRCAPEKGKTSFAHYAVRADRGPPYSDLRIAFSAVPEQGASVVSRITTRGVPVELTLPSSGAAKASLSVGSTSHEFDAPLGARPRIEFCVADGEAWAVVDGREVARAAVPLDARGVSRLEIGARGGPVTFGDAYVGRDIVYDAGGGPGVYDVPKDGFFFIGDNVEKSEDSRRWFVDVFHPPGGGAPIAAATEYPDENGNPVRGRIRTEKDRFVFLDVDGVPHDLPVEGTKRDRGVPWPFARRNHLVGRAFMIFWPLGTPDAGFRPRLLP